MKPERIDLSGVCDIRALIERVVETRLREVRRLETGLNRRDRLSLHDFRIACKRLRYALERFEDLEPSLQMAAERLALLQDALGQVHDRDGLLAILPPAMTQTERRLRGERAAYVDRAAQLWSEAQEAMRVCALIRFE